MDGQDRTNTPVVWTFAGQDHRLSWVDGQPVRVIASQQECTCDDDDDEECNFCKRGPRPDRHVAADTVFLYHTGPDLSAAEAAQRTFQAQGFDVSWDGTHMDAVTVRFGS